MKTLEEIEKITNQHQLELEEKFKVKRIGVFGSYARGEQSEGSDIDICVVSSIFGKDRLKERVMLMNIRSENDDLIEPHPFSPEDFSNPYDPLAYQIKNHGLLVM